MLTCDQLRMLCPSVPQEVEAVYQQICERWDDVVFTGSQAIGCATEASDWDFVVHDVEGFDPPFPVDTAGEISCEGVRYITTMRIGKVNLIVDHRGPEILDNWRIATDYCQEHCIFDKEQRIKAFEEMGAG